MENRQQSQIWQLYQAKFKKKIDISKVTPIDPHDNPSEMFIDFLHGTLELNLGTPGAVGNPKRKMNLKVIEKTVPFENLYTGGDVSVLLSRTRLCHKCHGHGGAPWPPWARGETRHAFTKAGIWQSPRLARSAKGPYAQYGTGRVCVW